MKKSVRERFEQQSILYVLSVLVAANMFIFVTLLLMERILQGAFYTAMGLLIAIGVMLSVPYWRYKKEGRKIRRLSNMLREDLFLMSFSLSFITVGTIVLIIMVYLRIQGIDF